MEITFYGVRGTVPVPGATTNEYGGNTSCIHVRTKKGFDIVLDAGTGICNLAKRLMGTALGKGKGEIALLLSHTHWDHIQGFPFFIPVFIPGNTVRVFGRQDTAVELKSLLDGQLNAIYSPIYGMSNLSASIPVTEIDDEPFALDGVHVASRGMPHGPNRSTAYRIDEEGHSVVYMTDLEHVDGKFSDESLRMAEGVHLLIHETYFTPEDYETAHGRGHSSMDTAVRFAREAGARQLVMFHYHPDYDDDHVRNLYERFRSQDGLAVIAAQEGLKLVL